MEFPTFTCVNHVAMYTLKFYLQKTILGAESWLQRWNCFVLCFISSGDTGGGGIVFKCSFLNEIWYEEMELTGTLLVTAHLNFTSCVCFVVWKLLEKILKKHATDECGH